MGSSLGMWVPKSKTHRGVNTHIPRLDPMDERGSATVVTAAVLALALSLCLFLADVGLFFAARSNAQNAADAAALAAVQQSFYLFNTGGDAEGAARELAGANGARLKSVDVARGGEKVEVEVTVDSRSLILGRMGIMPDMLSARAAAEIDIEALMASGEYWYLGDPGDAELVRAMLAAHSGELQGGLSTLVVLLAMDHLGKPYAWGAAGPNAFDCSGLVCYVFAQVGMRLPRVTYSQVRVGRPVSIGELAPGDLVFFRKNAHVGIYLGGGWFIHAPRSGDVVKISGLSSRKDVSACRRII